MPLRISRILHAGYVFECEGTQVAFDPIFENPFSVNCHAFPDVRFDEAQIRELRFAAVFISHFHDDHCSLDSLALLNRNTPLHVYCVFEELAALLRTLGFTRVTPLQLDVPVVVGPIKVTPKRALDADVDSIFHIEADDRSVLNVVDSWIDPGTLSQLATSAPWDVVLWPFQTMRELEVLTPSHATAEAVPSLPPEWLEQLVTLEPKYVVPSSCQFRMESWSWYNHAFFPITYRQFQEAVESILPAARVVRLDPSVSVVLDERGLRRAEPLTWVEPVGPQDVDYEFAPHMSAPPTSEVARRFAPLTADQMERVFDYCRTGLLERYRSLDPPSEPYFGRARVWRLSVYDHTGASRHFFYRVRGRHIDRLDDNTTPLSWSTEVPIAKLYAALESGESLTSMYMRINDTELEPQVQAELGAVDVIEDPLIRCLFSGVFGAYQRAQLRRLTRRGLA